MALKTFFDWLDDRTGLVTATSRCRESTVPRGTWLGQLWPSTILFTFVMQVVTGLVLWMYYSPSASSAWESVYYVQYELAGGWLLRGIHHYAAQVLVALLGLYVLQMVFTRYYRRPRELVFWMGVFLGLGAVALCLTGDLLAWDQNSLWATKTRVSFLMLLPGIGGYLFKLAAGGPAFGHLTLTRFFALHVGVFAAGFLVLLILHFWLAHRAAAKAEGDLAAGAGAGGPRYWPTQLLRNAVGWVAVMAVVLLLVFQNSLTGKAGDGPPGDYWGVELGAPGDTDPAAAYSAARPEWSFRGLYGFAHMFTGQLQIVPIFIVPGIIVTYMLAMPFLARWLAIHLLNVAALVLLLVGLVYLSWASYVDDFEDPDFLAAVAEGEAHADRAIELARGQGIPPVGALHLLRTDPKTQGPELFAQQCAACHNHSAPEGAIVAEETTAPELYGFGSRQWLTEFLDPEKIAGEKFYGNTRFARGVMVRFVEGRFAKLEPEEQKAIVAALSAEAKLPSQADQEAKDAERIARGRELIVSHCTRCHRFGDAGAPGEAPDLTGYGSAEWIMGIVADPAHPWLYDGRNDRMPAYAEFPLEPEKNRLPLAQVELIARWVRGQWFEPEAAGSGGEGEGSDAEPSTSPPPVQFALGKWASRRPAEPPPEPTTPKGRALALYVRAQCSLCHDYASAQGEPILARQPTAANLYGFAGEAWIRGLLDADQVAGRNYFGNSVFSEGDMVGFVQDDLPDYTADIGEDLVADLVETAMDDGKEEEFALEHLTELKAEIGEEELKKQVAKAVEDEKFEDFVEDHADELAERLGNERLGKLIAALAGQSAHQTVPKADEETEYLFEDFGCTDCHTFHSVGSASGPDLTGYGSGDWLAEILADPQHERFYGKRNDGMPSYLAFPGQDAQNLLTEEEIGLLTDLLRGKLEPGESGVGEGGE